MLGKGKRGKGEREKGKETFKANGLVAFSVGHRPTTTCHYPKSVIRPFVEYLCLLSVL